MAPRLALPPSFLPSLLLSLHPSLASSPLLVFLFVSIAFCSSSVVLFFLAPCSSVSVRSVLHFSLLPPFFIPSSLLPPQSPSPFPPLLPPSSSVSNAFSSSSASFSSLLAPRSLSLLLSFSPSSLSSSHPPSFLFGPHHFSFPPSLHPSLSSSLPPSLHPFLSLFIPSSLYIAARLLPCRPSLLLLPSCRSPLHPFHPPYSLPLFIPSSLLPSHTSSLFLLPSLLPYSPFCSVSIILSPPVFILPFLLGPHHFSSLLSSPHPFLPPSSSASITFSPSRHPSLPPSSSVFIHFLSFPTVLFSSLLPPWSPLLFLPLFIPPSLSSTPPLLTVSLLFSSLPPSTLPPSFLLAPHHFPLFISSSLLLSQPPSLFQFQE